MRTDGTAAIGRTRSGLLLALAAVAALGGCKRGEGAAAEETAAAPPAIVVGRENVVTAQEVTLASGPVISGSLAAERAAEVRAEVGGSIVQLLAEQGQPVKAGAVLARIDATALSDAVLSARAAARSAETNFQVVKRNAERTERLAQAGAVAEQELEQAHAAVANAEATAADAQARLASAQKELAKTTVRAPFAGIVSERRASAGDVVSPGTELFAVIDPSSMRLEATVPAQQLGQLSPGTPVDFSVTGFQGKSFRGKIARINPAVDPATRQVRIYVTIPNASRALVAGLFAEGRVAAESRRTVAVPFTAIDQRGTEPAVFRLASARVERVPVKLGMRDQVAEMIEIVSGVSAGDTVLLGSAQGLTLGTVVRVKEDESAARPR